MPPRWAVLASAYVGAVVGAGFASGQEILHFFVRHGSMGLAGSALAGLLFAVLGAASLIRVSVRQHPHYGALLRDVCGDRLGTVLDHLGGVGLFVGTAAVVAGAGSLGSVLWGWPQWWGSAGLAAALAASALGGRRALIHLNLIAAPLIVLSCLAAAFIGHPSAGVDAASAVGSAGWTWVLSATLYVAYNLLLGIAGLCAACDGSERPRDAAAAGITGGVLLGILCGAVTLALLAPGPGQGADLPLGAVMSRTPWGRLVYPCVLALSLWTTGNASTVALGRRAHAVRWPQLAALAALSALPLALFGLRAIVEHLYPILGYCGLPLLVGVLWTAGWSGRPLGKAGRAR